MADKKPTEVEVLKEKLVKTRVKFRKDDGELRAIIRDRNAKLDSANKLHRDMIVKCDNAENSVTELEKTVGSLRAAVADHKRTLDIYINSDIEHVQRITELEREAGNAETLTNDRQKIIIEMRRSLRKMKYDVDQTNSALETSRSLRQDDRARAIGAARMAQDLMKKLGAGLRGEQ